jgi:predicted NBD/HSP70 family sugar kinase
VTEDKEKMNHYIFEVDIDGTLLKSGVFDRSGYLTDKWEIPIHKKQPYYKSIAFHT